MLHIALLKHCEQERVRNEKNDVALGLTRVKPHPDRRDKKRKGERERKRESVHLLERKGERSRKTERKRERTKSKRKQGILRDKSFELEVLCE